MTNRLAADASLKEPRIVAEGVLTEDLYGRFARAHLKLTGGGRALWILAGFLFAVGAFLLALDLCFSDGGSEVRGTALTMMGCSLVMGLAAYGVPRQNARSVIGAADGFLDRPYTLWFYEEEYVETNALGEWHTPYASLYKVVETDGLILLYHNKTRADILEKGRFLKGAPDELTTYLRETCGLSYKRLQSE